MYFSSMHYCMDPMAIAIYLILNLTCTCHINAHSH
uniref:Uncharacterized protein n=1 Tax=Anguilla anguilla TaxID=7936 RepID=A0A0E9W0M0_ANGAN